ncbi:PREDICTED: protein swallow isoform X2 [Drosophila arizonae]|uniref:Protein swallow isoform X2 n=1 Tax=Drosophila arizonae TaxID=7263 RepID=A0ABM1PXI0_DROAR|nr:PREDICTED: protein swallow isoform X2 [Drosophila arizonae]
MSLQDESFPTDELFDQLNATIASDGNNQSFQRQYSMCLGLDVPDNIERQVSPFLNSDCSEKTCSSDPLGMEHTESGAKRNNGVTDTHLQLGSGRSNKAVSYQDIHTAYTKRTYKHVTSKVSKYIADIHDQEKQRRTSASTFQRHRSMPESLTPRGGTDDQQKIDHSLSLANSSSTDMHVRDESYERLVSEKDHLQSYNDYLESRLYKKINDNLVLRKNFEVIRTELTDCKEKLKRQAVAPVAAQSLRSLVYCPPNESVATQTDLPVMANLSNLSNMPALAANATPHPNTNLNDITYDSSVGSIEIPLLSVQPAAHQLKLTKSVKKSGIIKRLSLNFSNDSADTDVTGQALTGVAVGVSMEPTGTNGATTNHSGSSHPSSNDSAIEIEGNELRSPRVNYGPMREWAQREGLIYFDKHSNRVIELVPLNPHESSNGSSINQSQFSMLQYTANAHIGQRKKSLAARMLRLLGPCARCDDPNQIDTSTATYTVGIPLLANESRR